MSMLKYTTRFTKGEKVQRLAEDGYSLKEVLCSKERGISIATSGEMEEGEERKGRL